MDIRKLVNEMSVEDLCGQMLCYDIQPNDTEEETYDVIKRIRPGALFICGANEKTVADLTPFFERVSLVYPINIDDFLVPALQAENEIVYFNDYNHATVQRIRVNPEKNSQA